MFTKEIKEAGDKMIHSALAASLLARINGRDERVSAKLYASIRIDNKDSELLSYVLGSIDEHFGAES